jgi:hypothetical protein
VQKMPIPSPLNWIIQVVLIVIAIAIIGQRAGLLKNLRPSRKPRQGSTNPFARKVKVPRVGSDLKNSPPVRAELSGM